MKDCRTKIYLEERNTRYYIAKACKVIALLLTGIAIGVLCGSNAYAETYPRPQEWEIQKIPFWHHRGGKSLNDMQLYTLTDSVLQRLTFLDHTNGNLRDLCVETIIAESNGGYYIQGQVSNSDLGIAQIQLATAQDTLLWLENQPSIRKEVMAFIDNKVSLSYNLKYNAPFSVAMMATYYWRMSKGDKLYSRITTLEDRARLWKKRYNTYLGRGTAKMFITRVKEYN